MSSALIVFNQTLVMFLFMAAGYYFFRTGRFSLETSRQIGDLLLRLVVPCVIIRGFCIPFSPESLTELVQSSIAGALCLFLSLALSRLIFSRNRILRFASSFSNAGFMSIPLVTAAFGSSAVFYLSGFLALFNLIQWSFGKQMLSGQKVPFSWRSIVTNPMLIGIVIGLVLFLSGLGDSLPSVLSSVIDGFAGLNGPLAMFVIGSYAAQSHLETLFSRASLYGLCLVRLLLIPLVTLAILWVLPFEPRILYTLLIASSAPVGANVAIYSSLYGLDYTYGCQCVTISTLFSILTMPLILALASFVF